MGSVWRARHRTLGRSFAIKFLKTTLLGGESLEQRFLDEARMAASVQHRFVVDIVDFGVSVEAVPFMVMEFLEGESLERRCRRQPPLLVAEILRIGADVLLGLEAVHQAGIVHRDLKPDNVMLVHQADGTIPKLVDFGISQLEVQSADAGRRTQPGAVIGTPWYMSPEQARRDQTDRRSDIYSMGVILYEALAGVAPFDHDNLTLLLERVKAGGATPLHQRRPELTAELSEAIEQAMALEPAARFESAAQLSARLLELAERLPGTLACAPPPTVSRTDTEVVARRPRRHTCELAVPAPPVPSSRRRQRALAFVGAAVGAALLSWVSLKGRPAAPPIAPVTAQAAPLAAPLAEASSDEPEPSAPISTRRQPTLTARMPSPPVAAPEERHRRRVQARAEWRAPGRPGLPDVFRTPGF
jgi:serine/threonine-protein kinase